MFVFVELDGFTDGGILASIFKEGDLAFTSTIAFLYGIDEGIRIDAFMDVKGNGRDLECRVLCLASPLQLRVQVGVVLVVFLWSSGSFSARTRPIGGLLQRFLSSCLYWPICFLSSGCAGAALVIFTFFSAGARSSVSTDSRGVSSGGAVVFDLCPLGI